MSAGEEGLKIRPAAGRQGCWAASRPRSCRWRAPERPASGGGGIRIAVQEDNFLVVHFGCAAAQWEAFRPKCEAALAGFTAPVRAAIRDEPAQPKESQRTRDVAERITRAAPLIHILAKDPETGRPTKFGWGSGFIITEDGYLVTNRHVVDRHVDNAGRVLRHASDPVELTWDQGTGIPKAAADVIAVSHHYDIALLKIRGGGKWVHVGLCNSAKAKGGDRILVMGWPDPREFGETNVNQNEGSLTKIRRDGRNRIDQFVHSARTTGGNSGGPVYDLDSGGVIGAHYLGLVNDSKGFKEVFYHAAVPSRHIFWEFPQVTTEAPGRPTRRRGRR